MPLVGGVGAIKQADDTVHEVITAVLEELKAKIAEKINTSPRILQPISYKTQVVAGTNYFVKIKLDDEDYVHARIYRNLQGVSTVHGVSEKKAAHDEVEYF